MILSPDTAEDSVIMTRSFTSMVYLAAVMAMYAGGKKDEIAAMAGYGDSARLNTMRNNLSLYFLLTFTTFLPPLYSNSWYFTIDFYIHSIDRPLLPLSISKQL